VRRVKALFIVWERGRGEKERAAGPCREPRRPVCVWIGLAFDAEEGDQTNQEAGLTSVGIREGAALEEGLIGEITAVLETAEEKIGKFVLAGKCNRFDLLCGSGDEAILVVVILDTRGESEFLGNLIAVGSGETEPVVGATGGGKALCAVIEVEIGGRFCIEGVEENRIGEVTPALVRIVLLRAGVVVLSKSHLADGERGGESHGFAAIVVSDIVPAVDQLKADSQVLIEWHGGAKAEVVVGTIGKEQRAGVVPIEVSFRGLRTSTGVELAEVELEAFAVFWFETDVSLGDVAHGVKAVGFVLEVEIVHGTTEAEIEFEADWSGVGFNHDAGHVELKTIAADIEVTQGIEAGSRVIGVVVRISIDQAGKANGLEGEGGLGEE